jgi:hypothetical protein
VYFLLLYLWHILVQWTLWALELHVLAVQGQVVLYVYQAHAVQQAHVSRQPWC